MKKLSFVRSLGSDGVETFRFDKSKNRKMKGIVGHYLSSEKVQVDLFRDTNGNGRLDSTDRLIKSRSAVAGEDRLFVQALALKGTYFIKATGEKNASFRFRGEIRDLFTNTNTIRTASTSSIQYRDREVVREVQVPVYLPMPTSPTQPASVASTVPTTPVTPAKPVDDGLTTVSVVGRSSNADYLNTGGLYRISPDGAVIDPLTGTKVQPGQPGYEKAALRNSALSFDFGSAEPVVASLEEGLYGAYLVVDGSTNDALSGNKQVFFEFDQANLYGSSQVRKTGSELGKTYQFEDTLVKSGMSDSDFNDGVFTVKIA